MGNWRRMAWQASAFLIAAGLAGEAFELLRLGANGMTVAPRLGLTLFGAYVILGSISYVFAGFVSWLFSGRFWTLAFAAGSFAILVIVPWLNFFYFPHFLSAKSIFGNGLAIISLLVVCYWLVSRLPRVVAALVLLGALGVNVATYAGGGDSDVGRSTDQVPRGPNVLIFLIDTLRADHLGLYGYARPTSPSIDLFGSASVVFERTISQAPWTKPSVASLLTGTYTQRHGVITREDALGPDFTTLAEELWGQGYRTAAFSSNPFISPGFGFDRGFGYFYHSAPPSGIAYTVLFRFLSRVKRYLSRVGISADLTGWVRAPADDFPSNRRRDELLTSDLIRWLGKVGDQPFFAYAHLIGPHVPYDPPSEYVRDFRPPEWDGERPPIRHPTQVRSIFEKAPSLSELDYDVLVAQYDGAIKFTDQLFGKVIDELRRLNLMDDTLIVVLSDHGEEFYEHGNWGHGNQLYSEVIRVPLLFHFPAALGTGRRHDAAMVVDVYPTVTTLLGIQPTASVLDGRNLFSGTPDRERVFSEYYRYEGAKYESRLVLQDDLKMIATEDGASGKNLVELYDLGVDEQEQSNLMDPDGSTTLAAGELTKALEQFGEGGPARSVVETKIDEETAERLRRLGY